jgi:hypothetical protein
MRDIFFQTKKESCIAMMSQLFQWGKVVLGKQSSLQVGFQFQSACICIGGSK